MTPTNGEDEWVRNDLWGRSIALRFCDCKPGIYLESRFLERFFVQKKPSKSVKLLATFHFLFRDLVYINVTWRENIPPDRFWKNPLLGRKIFS
jgi:hypothetical protein